MSRRCSHFFHTFPAFVNITHRVFDASYCTIDTLTRYSQVIIRGRVNSFTKPLEPEWPGIQTIKVKRTAWKRDKGGWTGRLMPPPRECNDKRPSTIANTPRLPSKSSNPPSIFSSTTPVLIKYHSPSCHLSFYMFLFINLFLLCGRWKWQSLVRLLIVLVNVFGNDFGICLNETFIDIDIWN